MAGIHDGATVLIGGFGNAGQPMELIDALMDCGATDLTVVNNNAGQADAGLALLIKERRVKKIICSFPRQSDSWHFDTAYRAGEIELELVPQGNLAERIRAAGAGIGGFFTPTGYGTMLAEGKETRMIDGKGYVLESPIHARLRADQGADARTRRATWSTARPPATSARSWPPPPRKSSSRSPTSWRPASSIPSHRDAGHLRGHRRRNCAAGRRRRGTLVSEKLSREDLARLVAQDIQPGSFVNLGIGQPTSVSNYLTAEQDITLHTENGMLGMGPEAHGDEIDQDLINAGKVPVTEVPGASYFHHADSFAMMRGGHLDVCVLGAFQVSATGDLANWHTGAPDAIPAVGGAMDLATGAKDVYVMMSLFAKDGTPKLVPECSYPLTGVGCVTRVYTNDAVFLLTPEGVRVRETFGTTLEELQSKMDIKLLPAHRVKPP